VSTITVFAISGLLGAGGICTQQPVAPPTAIIRGVVVDAGTGQPLARVLVRVEDRQDTLTSDAGTFEFQALPREKVRLTVSVVGYILVQRVVDLTQGDVLDLRIPVAGGTGTYTETVTVTAAPFRAAEPGVAVQQTLGSAELQVLRGVLADDPLRAVQVLPGVATGDDLKSEFSVRGSDFNHMNFTVEGFRAPFLLHTVRVIEDRASTGSVAMINSDVVEEATLLSGGYAQRFGNRTGAELDFRLRSGSRDRTQLRLAVGGTAASVVVEGPLGRSRRGSWLLSARKSYLDKLIDRLTDEGLGFAFSDFQGKAVYDISQRHKLELAFVAGTSRLERSRTELDANDFYTGSNESSAVIGTWHFALARGFVAARVFAGTNEFHNDTLAGVPLDQGTDRELGARVDFAAMLRKGLELDGGIQVEHDDRSRHHDRETGNTFRTVNAFDADALRSGAYLHLKWDAGHGFSLMPGLRADQWTLTGQQTASPWLLTEWRGRRGLSVRAATGMYRQFPEFEHVVGMLGVEGMPPERAATFDVGVEQTLRDRWRLAVSGFHRAEGDFIRRPGGETKIVNGRLVRGSQTAPYASRLSGDATGVEVLVQRRDPNGLSGWLAYSFGKLRYTDTVTAETFWGDLDQRHALNAYASYRVSPHWNVGAKLRVGSNFPIAGYYVEQDGVYFISDRRNEERLPVYARLDIRASRTFTWTRARMTLFGEVINVLDRDNVRSNPPTVDSRTWRVSHLFETMIPIVPSAGILLEF
jgi:TonB-dependent receptor-like protein/carboxypeptidase-like protein